MIPTFPISYIPAAVVFFLLALVMLPLSMHLFLWATGSTKVSYFLTYITTSGMVLGLIWLL
jgi:ABC-type transport system involved in cytochrome bd biosynthesis fused ATPase/permease subunit